MHSVNEIPTCTICYEDIREPSLSDYIKKRTAAESYVFIQKIPVTTRCGHQFHRCCLTSWVANSSTCPLDRKALSGRVRSITVRIDKENECEYCDISTDIRVKDLVQMYQSTLSEESLAKHISVDNSHLRGLNRVGNAIDLDETILANGLVDDDVAHFSFLSKNSGLF